MYPHPIEIAGQSVSIWNVAFLVGVLLAYLVFRPLARREAALTAPTLRFVVVVYSSALAAQLFSYAFDLNTSLRPPAGVSPWVMYLSPVAGPKTLYGVIVLMPVAVGVATMGTRLPLTRALDLWTTPMLTVLSMARVGCLLQGCCFGMRSEALGLAFPVGSPVYWQQRGEGLIGEGALWSLRVIPTQAIEAAVLALLAGAIARYARYLKSRDGATFLIAIGAYSLFRFAIEFVRADVERGFYGPLATSQWIALVVLAATALGFLRQRSGLELEDARLKYAATHAAAAGAVSAARPPQ